jgi:hypothetical protein
MTCSPGRAPGRWTSGPWPGGVPSCSMPSAPAMTPDWCTATSLPTTCCSTAPAASFSRAWDWPTHFPRGTARRVGDLLSPDRATSRRSASSWRVSCRIPSTHQANGSRPSFDRPTVTGQADARDRSEATITQARPPGTSPPCSEPGTGTRHLPEQIPRPHPPCHPLKALRGRSMRPLGAPRTGSGPAQRHPHGRGPTSRRPGPPEPIAAAGGGSVRGSTERRPNSEAGIDRRWRAISRSAPPGPSASWWSACSASWPQRTPSSEQGRNRIGAEPA